MGSGLLGASGGGSAGINDGELYVDYWLGSASAVSHVSIIFKKNNDGNYYFNEYTTNTSNYGVENLFAREKITAAQTGKLDFATTSENDILKKGKSNTSPVHPVEPSYDAADRYNKYVPEGFRLAAFSKGDLNMDGLKNDLLLVLYNEEVCSIRILLQQNNGTYKLTESNTQLIVPDETFNVNNFKVVIKNGYFTIEQRVPDGDMDFDHRYITFKYDVAQKNWLLYRYDMEHFSGFNTKPSSNVTHLTQQHFGKILFEKLDYTPGDYGYDPATTTISGTLTEKQFYGRPNYGETPETDEKVEVFILKPDYPVNVLAAPNQPDPETSDKTFRNITEIQVYSTDTNVLLSKKLNQKVTLKGVLFIGRSGGHYTKVVMEVRKIAD
jgi:hypothetical protein